MPEEHTKVDRLKLAHEAPSNRNDYLVGWKFSEPEPVAPDGYAYWRRGGSAPQPPDAVETYAKYASDTADWRKRAGIAQDVAARFAYADALIASLNTNPEKTGT